MEKKFSAYTALPLYLTSNLFSRNAEEIKENQV